MTLPRSRPVEGLMPLTLAPPFRSSRLSMSYLPLRARLDQLTRFCDAYLNAGSSHLDAPGLPPEVGVFRPRFPLVYLIVAAHPRLESRTDQIYLVQHELAFSIPVEVRRRERGRWRHAGHAFTQPFIYIDSPLGMTTGRLVWGWPKAMAAFESKQGWAEGQGRLRMTLPELGAAPLITIGRHRAPARGPSIDGAWSWGTGAWRTLAMSYASMMRDLLASWLDPRGALDHVEVLWRQLAQLPAVPLDIVTLKQFPATDQSAAEHQAIVHSSAKVTRIHEVRLLGAESQALGVLSGGLRVDILRHELQPIVELLGLEPDQTSTGAGGHTIRSFEPLMPFRAIIDADYAAGVDLCHRARAGSWYRGHVAPDVEPASFGELTSSIDHPYVTACGAATQVLEHPRTVPGLRLCVYPLATNPDPERLRKLCRDCLGLDAPPYDLQITEPHVYLVTARSGSLGLVSLCVPVSITDGAGRGHRAVVIPLEHASSGREAITAMEYAGRRMMPAELRWHEPAEDGVRFSLRAELAPALGAGHRAELLPVLEILTPRAPDERPAPDGRPTPDEPRWWQERAAPRPVAATVLALASFPHARFVGRACVQERIAMEHTLEPRPDTYELLPAAQVRFHDHASQPLVDVFDLAGAVPAGPGARAVRACSPWAVEVDLKLSRRELWPSGLVTPG